MKLGTLTKLEVKPNREKTEFRFLLSFGEQPRQVEFSTSADGAMMIMHGLQQLQAFHKLPIPERIRPRGKPKLQLVKLDQ